MIINHFFDQPVKNQQEVSKKLIEMLTNDDYKTRKLLGFWYYRTYYYKLIGIALSRQTDTSIAQQTSFTGELEKVDGVTMFFISKKQQKSILNVSLNSFIVTE